MALRLPVAADTCSGLWNRPKCCSANIVACHPGELGLFSLKRRLRGDPINTLRVGVKRMGPDSFQWCPPTAQGAMGTN